jgi:PBP1b-binding outer membrane lipoprotein LpoB
MKKVAFILVVAFVTALIVSSCNKEACPAYSKADAPKTTQVG